MKTFCLGWVLAWYSLFAQMFPFPGPGTVSHAGATMAYTGQFSKNALSAAATSIATSTTVNVPAGATYVVFTGHAGDNPGTSGTCGADTLTRAIWSGETNDSGFITEAWVKFGATANAAASCTVNFPASYAFRSIQVAVFTGPTALDQSSCQPSSAAACAAFPTTIDTNRTATNLTTTATSGIAVWGSIEYFTHTWTPQNGFTMLQSGTPDYQAAYKIFSSSGVYPNGNVATVDNSADNHYLAAFVILK